MTPKPFAALTSGLLARKGQAKPAMRPQGFGALVARHEDLGWNDLGSSPAPEPPPVVRQQEALAASFAPKPIRAKATELAGKASFTLRLDSERHLRLRIASAIACRSSQQLVTQALDAFLETMPELDDLVARAKADPKSKFHA